MTVGMAPGSGTGGVTTSDRVQLIGRGMPGHMVALLNLGPGRHRVEAMAHAGPGGWFKLNARVQMGANPMVVRVLGVPDAPTMPMTVVRGPTLDRPFTGSPAPAGEPFSRLIPDSQSYGPNVPARPDPRLLSQLMAEDPNHQSYSATISLGIVFFGQFVDHDLTSNDEGSGQGPSVDPANPINLRTPALDLDSVYGGGPIATPQYYTPDGLFFRLGPGGNDYPRDANGVAIIPETRNDDNGIIEEVQLSFEKYHNLLMSQALHGTDPNSLTPNQKAALFDMVHNDVVGYYQGIVANELSTAFTGKPLPTNEPPLANLPIEFSGAVYRVGHTLVPNMMVVDNQGDIKNPTDPTLRGVNGLVPLTLLFGPHAQPGAAMDTRISDTMRTLLIPLSPTDPAEGDFIGGNAPNIGQGNIIDGVMHLDLVETNILRGRELHLPSGEEYLAHMQGRPYNPLTDGNTDLFVYILEEAGPLGHLGAVGTDVFDRALGGIIAADPYRYNNPAIFTPAQIQDNSRSTFEELLHRIGTPGF